MAQPPDEAWLRFLGFNKSGEDTASIAVLEGDLNDGKSSVADAVFRNTSTTVGTIAGGTGTGVFVTSARIDYRMSGYSPPSVEYPLNLYLPASSIKDGTVTSSEATVTDLPLAPVSLKHWLNANGVRSAAVDLTANVTFSAETDEGGKLETHGRIGIVLTNTATVVTKAICVCSSDLYHCMDFTSAASARECYKYCVSLGVGDIHGLDEDKDGLACE